MLFIFLGAGAAIFAALFGRTWPIAALWIIAILGFVVLAMIWWLIKLILPVVLFLGGIFAFICIFWKNPKLGNAVASLLVLGALIYKGIHG